MGKCGQPGYVFRDFCLSQGTDFITFCLNQGTDFSNFCPKQGIFSWTINSLRVCSTNLSCYAKKWQMRVNIKKTKALIFNKSGKISRSEFKLGNQPIQETDSFVYLGITFTPSADFLPLATY